MDSTPKKRGRPAIGRSTHMLRVQREVSKEFAERAYFEWLPVLESYAANCKDNPRYDKLRKLLTELGFECTE
jgi:hypothetical protein